MFVFQAQSVRVALGKIIMKRFLQALIGSHREAWLAMKSRFNDV